MSRTSALRLSLAGISALFMTHASITIAPASHDFGDFTVYGVSPSSNFRITVPSSTVVLTVTQAGPDMADFAGGNEVFNLADPNSPCTPGPQGVVCTVSVDFRPKSLGPKLARLDVTDLQGNRATAQLKGKGIAPMCQFRVVHCNFAHLWSGIFGWTSVTRGPAYFDSTGVDVRVTNGFATCRGEITGSEGGGPPRTGRIAGPGLIAVEFLKDPVYNWVYLITVACPSPAFPADPNSGTPATPSNPAEMGHEEQSSERQPATSQRTITLEQVLSQLLRLQGQITQQQPADPANPGITGRITITWNLTRS